MKTSAWVARSRSPQRIASAPPWIIEGYGLRAHPDLHDGLLELARGLSGCRADFAYGCPILVGPSGLICAVAEGMRHLHFRLPAELRPLAGELKGRDRPDIVRGWLSLDAWDREGPRGQHLGDLRYWCAQACAGEEPERG
jgi:hypothetical protein